MSNSRKDFEDLPDIKGILSGSDFRFNESLNQYHHPDHTNHRISYAFLMGAWMAFQEQQKKIDELKSQLDSFALLICWNCEGDMTKEQHSKNDGFCIHCNAEMELLK